MTEEEEVLLEILINEITLSQPGYDIGTEPIIFTPTISLRTVEPQRHLESPKLDEQQVNIEEPKTTAEKADLNPTEEPIEKSHIDNSSLIENRTPGQSYLSEEIRVEDLSIAPTGVVPDKTKVKDQIRQLLGYVQSQRLLAADLRVTGYRILNEVLTKPQESVIMDRTRDWQQRTQTERANENKEREAKIKELKAYLGLPAEKTAIPEEPKIEKELNSPESSAKGQTAQSATAHIDRVLKSYTDYPVQNEDNTSEKAKDISSNIPEVTTKAAYADKFSYTSQYRSFQPRYDKPVLPPLPPLPKLRTYPAAQLNYNRDTDMGAVIGMYTTIKNYPLSTLRTTSKSPPPSHDSVQANMNLISDGPSISKVVHFSKGADYTLRKLKSTSDTNITDKTEQNIEAFRNLPHKGFSRSSDWTDKIQKILDEFRSEEAGAQSFTPVTVAAPESAKASAVPSALPVINFGNSEYVRDVLSRESIALNKKDSKKAKGKKSLLYKILDRRM